MPQKKKYKTEEERRLAKNESQKKYYRKNKKYYAEKIKEYYKDPNSDYKEKHLAYKRGDKAKKQRIINQKKREKKDLFWKISRRYGSYISYSMKRYGGVKAKKTKEILGLEIEDFRKYLEKKFKPGMTWENYGKWHIDHIKPVSKHDLKNEEDIKRCYHYTNLQPLWAIDNIKKSNKIL